MSGAFWFCSDASVASWTSPFPNRKTYILVIRNAIYVPTMVNNLIPPFMMREAGINANERAKIHTTNPTTNDHSIIFPSTGFRITLFLHGIFSFFPSNKPTNDDLQVGYDTYVLTPAVWHPHSTACADNEAGRVDCEGNIKEKEDWSFQVVLDDIPPVDETTRVASTISSVETKMINCV